jgi:hypothetical protein
MLPFLYLEDQLSLLASKVSSSSSASDYNPFWQLGCIIHGVTFSLPLLQNLFFFSGKRIDWIIVINIKVNMLQQFPSLLREKWTHVTYHHITFLLFPKKLHESLVYISVSFSSLAIFYIGFAL